MKTLVAIPVVGAHPYEEHPPHFRESHQELADKVTPSCACVRAEERTAVIGRSAAGGRYHYLIVSVARTRKKGVRHLISLFNAGISWIVLA